MKKMALVLVVTLASNTGYAFYGSQLIQKEHNQDQTKLRFLDADSPNDEYGYQDNCQTDMDEYDQHVCDDAQSPKVSAAEALIKEMLSFVLIQYLTLKEMANHCCQEVKDVIQQWFGFTRA